MVEVKISLSDKTDEVVQKLSDELGIKKTEFVKSLVIENLKSLNFKNEKKK